MVSQLQTRLKMTIRFLTVYLCFMASPGAIAHMMVAQNGTLNIVNNGGFMVLSLPVSAFGPADENNDGKLSNREFQKHRTRIGKMVKKKVTLSDKLGEKVLQGLMLTPVVSHDTPQEPVSQLVVTGRYKLSELKGPLVFTLNLFGKAKEETSYKISVSNRQLGESMSFTITPKSTNQILDFSVPAKTQ